MHIFYLDVSFIHYGPSTIFLLWHSTLYLTRNFKLTRPSQLFLGLLLQIELTQLNNCPVVVSL